RVPVLHFDFGSRRALDRIACQNDVLAIGAESQPADGVRCGTFAKAQKFLAVRRIPDLHHPRIIQGSETPANWRKRHTTNQARMSREREMIGVAQALKIVPFPMP